MNLFDAITEARRVLADKCGLYYIRKEGNTGYMTGGEPRAADAYNTLAEFHAKLGGTVTAEEARDKYYDGLRRARQEEACREQQAQIEAGLLPKSTWNDTSAGGTKQAAKETTQRAMQEEPVDLPEAARAALSEMRLYLERGKKTFAATHHAWRGGSFVPGIPVVRIAIGIENHALPLDTLRSLLDALEKASAPTPPLVEEVV